jgi:hypothetical protein
VSLWKQSSQPGECIHNFIPSSSSMKNWTYPAKYTFFPPLSTLQLAQRVCALSKGVLAAMCWQGRQPIVATTSSSPFAAPSSCLTTDFLSPSASLTLESLNSRLSHQSSSVELCIPTESNHCLFPKGAKNCTFGCFSLILNTVGKDR